MTSKPTFRCIAVLAYPGIPHGLEEARRIAQALQAYGVEGVSGSFADEGLRKDVQEGRFDLLIVLGGDGTMLRAGHLAAPQGVPILGINMGRFGFLMEVHRDAWPTALERLMQGDFWLEQRMTLDVRLHRGKDVLASWLVVNEVVVCRGAQVRPVRLTAYVDDILLTTYVADGLIVATPTGSTAYALAAGGPILPPESRNILLVPVAPHLSVDRAMVLPESATITILPHVDHETVVSADGQSPLRLQDGDRVVVQTSPHAVRFVRFQDRDYFYRVLTRYLQAHPWTQKYP